MKKIIKMYLPQERLNIALLCLFTAIMLMLFTCCETDIKRPDESRNSSIDTASLTAFSSKIESGKVPVEIESIGIRWAFFTDLNSGASAPVGYSISSLVAEFRDFICSQKYTESTEKWDTIYKAELRDESDALVLEIAFGARSVTFDRPVLIGGKVLEKGVAYETDLWVSDNMQKFCEGSVLDPVHSGSPAKLGIPGDECDVSLSDRGVGRINLYETVAGLHDMARESILGTEFEITGSCRYYDVSSMEAAAAKIESEDRCIILNFNTSETYLDIESANEYKEYAKAYRLIIGKPDDKSGTYFMVTDNMVFTVKADSDLNRRFQALFSNEEKSDVKLAPGDIKRLMGEKKPYYMEYICRNLGIGSWNPRGDDRLESKRMKLDGRETFTVLELSNAYNTRLLIFNDNSGNHPGFVDCIDFGGRSVIDVDLHFINSKGHTFIAGNSCKGYGTGEARYYRDWYTVSGDGKKLVLSYPIDDFIQPPWGGYYIKAVKTSFDSNGPAVLADFSLERMFLLEIGEADEYGQVEAKGSISVKFCWDEAAGRFVSSFGTDESGMTVIPADCPEITDQCDKLLDRYYDTFAGQIKSAAEKASAGKTSAVAADGADKSGENSPFAQEFKLRGIKYFLDSCSDSQRKSDLIRMLSDMGME